MNHHWIGGTDQKTTVDWVNGRDFVFTHMGTAPHTIGNCSIDYIQVWENGHTHSYESGVCTGCGEADPDYVVIPTLTLKAPTLEFKDMICVVAFYTAENLQNVVQMGMITYTDMEITWESIVFVLWMSWTSMYLWKMLLHTVWCVHGSGISISMRSLILSMRVGSDSHL